jgi:hypothetical protein
MPDIVLDLDAEGQTGVREFDEEYEAKLLQQWAGNPRREAMKAVVNTLENEAARLRHSWEDIMTQPASPWRISHHDFMSVALRGVADVSDHPKSNRMGPGGQPDFVHFLCQTNGIPAHAAKNDESLLEWMLIRKSALEQRVAARNDQHPTFLQFAEAAEGAQSFLELRRVITTFSFGSPGNEHNAIANFGANGAVSQAVQNAVVRLLQDCEPDSPEMEEAMREALATVMNAEASMCNSQPVDSANLWIFGLQLATSQSLPAKIVLLCRGLEAGYATVWPGPGQHFAKSIRSLAQNLEDIVTSEHGHLLSHAVGSALLRVLTGIVRLDQAGATSIRAYILDADSNDLTSEVRFNMYMSYITHLGRLGAVRTLWVEYHTVPDVVESIQPESDQAPSDGHRLREAIVAAAMTAPLFETAQGSIGEYNMSLQACAWADYRDLASKGVLSDSRAGSSSLVKLDSATMEAALQQPLQRFLEDLTRQQRGDVETYEVEGMAAAG